MRFSQVDVFTDTLTLGNPVAVVHDAAGLDESRMQAFARWTNLSETTFLLPPTQAGADYRVRVFTPGGELPFAGHPTLGSARAWLAAGGVPANPGTVVQECAVGLVRIRLDATVPGRAAFAAPPLRRSGPVDDATRERLTRAVGVPADRVQAAQWVDNGPGWAALLLATAQDVLDARADRDLIGEQAVGLVAPHPAGGPADVEVRAFHPGVGVQEDPVTGSLAAGLGQWLTSAALVPARFTIRQGTVLGRRGLIRVERDGEQVWVGGDTVLGIQGTVALD